MATLRLIVGGSGGVINRVSHAECVGSMCPAGLPMRTATMTLPDKMVRPQPASLGLIRQPTVSRTFPTTPCRCRSCLGAKFLDQFFDAHPTCRKCSMHEVRQWWWNVRRIRAPCRRATSFHRPPSPRCVPVFQHVLRGDRNFVVPRGPFHSIAFRNRSARLHGDIGLPCYSLPTCVSQSASPWSVGSLIAFWAGVAGNDPAWPGVLTGDPAEVRNRCVYPAGIYRHRIHISRHSAHV